MKKNYFLILLFLFFTRSAFGQQAFVGEVRLFAGNFAPTGWALCEGQLMPISQYTALFSLLGTSYGGDGESTFALPNLNGSMVIGEGEGPGLSTYDHGQTGGVAEVVLLPDDLPAHNHTGDIMISTTEGTTSTPGSDKSLAAPNHSFNGVIVPAKGYISATGNVTLETMPTSATGNSTRVNIRQPILAARYIIAIQGVFPQRQ